MTTDTETVSFVEDFLAGDGLVCAEIELSADKHGDPPDGASIIARMRTVHCEPTNVGGYYVLTGDQVAALADLADWFALPADDATAPPEAALLVLTRAREIVSAPVPRG